MYLRQTLLALLAATAIGTQAQHVMDVNTKKLGAAVQPTMYGLFFEDINFAADGGLYGELVKNRSFEFAQPLMGWRAFGRVELKDDGPFERCPHYVVLSDPGHRERRTGLENEGYFGIGVEKDKEYRFTVWARAPKGSSQIRVQLINPSTMEERQEFVQQKLDITSTDWKKYEVILKSPRTEAKAQLRIFLSSPNQVCLEHVSLFPVDTYKGRENGLRRDLAEALEDVHPGVFRFPGGCIVEGTTLDTRYQWKNTIGPVENRPTNRNRWEDTFDYRYFADYYQSYGLGFYEFFLLSEDIGAEPLPVLAAGVPCQNSMANAEGFAGQQGGIPMEDMPAYIDELCHLIEWANADPKTNEWAAKRAAAGHPEPFNLKYIGIGNEDIISTTFEERYVMICRALLERHPEIKVCGTVGPFHTPSADYIEGWDLCRRHPDLQFMTDEHYYESTGWFLHHRDYYDRYDRQGTKVYLGEWAASTRVKRPNVETALAEALYLTDVERNGDVVEMTSYAPMLCKEGHHNWDPDMIYFTNTEVRTTPAYEVQRLFSVYSGDRFVNVQCIMNNEQLRHRGGASLVRDSRSGRRYLKLVNALPVGLNFKVSGLELPQSVKCEQFTGRDIEDQKAKAETIETDAPTSLPPYSIRVIEL